MTRWKAWVPILLGWGEGSWTTTVLVLNLLGWGQGIRGETGEKAPVPKLPERKEGIQAAPAATALVQNLLEWGQAMWAAAAKMVATLAVMSAAVGAMSAAAVRGPAAGWGAGRGQTGGATAGPGWGQH